ncbi:MAG TPA: terminase large subunit, partial [bacterium]|nr:terminase large subunit [bacterium]
MNYPQLYLNKILKGKTVVSTKVKAVYERECDWMKKPPVEFPYYFDIEAGLRPIEFIETFCRHSKGRWAGKRIELDLFQKAKIQLAFGWLEKETGLRRFREVVDIRARKTGKSTETAGVSLYMLMADGEAGAEVYACANKLDQAKIIFDEAVNMRFQSPDISKLTTKRQSDIFFQSTMSIYKALSSETKTMDGMNAHFFSLDEWHEARTSDIFDVMWQSMSSREQPMAWLISTNGFVREGFFDDKYRYASSVAMWEEGFEDYRMLPLIYELDNRDEWTNSEMWEKANPGLHTIKSFQALSENVDRAKRDPSFLPTLLVKDFNIPENSSKRWLTYADIVNEEVVDMEYLRSSYAIGFCDLSSTIDLTCAGVLIRKPNDDKTYVLQRYFLPQSRVDLVEETSAREAPYKLWAEQGWLEICPGASVDYNAVTEYFKWLVETWDIRPLWVFYDRALSGYWVPQMEQNDFDMEKIAQGPFTWTYPMKNLGAALTEKKVIYQNNPILRWCLLNTGVKTLNRDGIQSIQPVKVAERLRIDGMVALLNGWVGLDRHYEEYMRYLR